MPELPEVETIRRGLEKFVTGRTVTKVQVLHPRPVRWDESGPEHFARSITGREFKTPARRGKYLWLPFADGDALVAHLGMSGQFRINSAEDELARNTRVIFDLDDSTQLRFVDQRMFGGLLISEGGAQLPKEVSHIAADVFDTDFNPAAVAEDMASRRSTIKRLLLNQQIISGVGNIYADESLWSAKLHYDRPAGQISESEYLALFQSLKTVMAAAIKAGGTSFDELYVNVDGSAGYFERELSCYGRQGKPCKRCGEKIERAKFMNRSSYFCPQCQQLDS